MFDGENITRWRAHDIARQGMARTFQLLRIFSGMSVLENMLIGHHGLIRYGVGLRRDRLAQGVGRGAARARGR